MRRKVTMFISMCMAMLVLCIVNNVEAKDESSVLVNNNTDVIVRVGDTCELATCNKFKHRVQFRVNKMKACVQNFRFKTKANVQRTSMTFQANRANRVNSRQFRLQERSKVFKINRANRTVIRNNCFSCH